MLALNIQTTISSFQGQLTIAIKEASDSGIAVMKMYRPLLITMIQKCVIPQLAVLPPSIWITMKFYLPLGTPQTSLLMILVPQANLPHLVTMQTWVIHPARVRVRLGMTVVQQTQL